METLNAIAVMLRFAMFDVEVRRRQLWARPSHDMPERVVARLNLSDAVVLVPEYHEAEMVLPARTVHRGEDPAKVATEIVKRVLRLAVAA